ncbi:MAG: hypothetical protein ACYS30_22255 [Planctomycetota bacterium]|jgi:hypothetical protein
MDMDDFEAQLKRLPLARPSEGMRRRIFGDRPGGSWFVEVLRRRIPVGWAAAFALAAGIAGMSGSQMWSGKAAAPLQPVVHVQIIKSPSDRNLFDFTEPAKDFMPGELTVNVQAPQEI